MFSVAFSKHVSETVSSHSSQSLFVINCHLQIPVPYVFNLFLSALCSVQPGVYLVLFIAEETTSTTILNKNPASPVPRHLHPSYRCFSARLHLSPRYLSPGLHTDRHLRSSTHGRRKSGPRQCAHATSSNTSARTVYSGEIRGVITTTAKNEERSLPLATRTVPNAKTTSESGRLGGALLDATAWSCSLCVLASYGPQRHGTDGDCDRRSACLE